MATCDYCGTMILFGGTRNGNLRYCNARCQQAGTLLAISKKIPDAQVRESVWKVHQGTCPKCGGSGPVDVHKSYRVWSALVLTRWSSMQQLSCRPCGIKKQMSEAAISLVAGWWGFPWGLILTPIQVGRNLASLAKPPEVSKPSPEMEKVLRIAMARQAVTAAQAKA